jgi:hypothetical protein
VVAHHNVRLKWNLLMRDYLAWRMAFGITTPSTNTVVQPEYDDMRPPGVTNHLGRMVIPDLQTRTNEDFDESIRLIDAALDLAEAPSRWHVRHPVPRAHPTSTGPQ